MTDVPPVLRVMSEAPQTPPRDDRPCADLIGRRDDATARRRLMNVWSDVAYWRDRLDATVDGDAAEILPALWGAWLREQKAEAGAALHPGARGLAHIEDLAPDRLHELVDDFMRTVFAIGAAWGARGGPAIDVAAVWRFACYMGEA